MQKKVKSVKLQSFLITGLLMIAMLVTACQGFPGQQQQQPIEGGAIAEPPVEEAEEVEIEAGVTEVTEEEGLAETEELTEEEVTEEGIVETEGLPEEEAVAETQQQQETQQQLDQMALKASALLGRGVQNEQGEQIGNIMDLIVDLNNDQIQYVILGAGGLMQRNDLIAVPANAFQFDQQQETITLSANQEALQTAPGFAQDEWPDIQNPDWDAVIIVFWQENMPEAMAQQQDQQMQQQDQQQQAQQEQDQQMQQVGMLVRVSELMNYPVQDMQGQQIGQVEDLLVNMEQDQVHSVVLTFDEAATGADPDMLYAIPVNELQADQQQQAFQYSFDQAALQDVPSFTSNQWAEDELQVQVAMMQQPDQMQQQQVMGILNPLKASALIGHEIEGPNREQLGQIEDLMVNINNDQIKYLVLSLANETMDAGDNLHLVPLNAIEFDQQMNTFVAGVSGEMVQNAPGFAQDNWPDATTPDWDSDVEAYWSDFIDIPADETEGNQAVRASQILGYDIVNLEDEQVGQLEDLAVDMSTGQIVYAVLSLDEATFDMADSDMLYAIQLSGLNENFEQGHFQYPIDQEAIGNLPTIPQDQWATDQVSIDIEELGTIDQ